MVKSSRVVDRSTRKTIKVTNSNELDIPNKKPVPIRRTKYKVKN